MILQRAILCFHPSTTPNYINYNMKLLSGMSHLDLQPPTPSPQNIPNTDNLKLTWTGRWRCNDPNSGTVFGVTHCSPRAPSLFTPAAGQPRLAEALGFFAKHSLI